MRYAAALEGAGKRSLPPVEKWNPDFCGEIDMIIKRDGTWFHEGSPIGRARLVRLFSTILRREGNNHFLVTPVEKLKLQVEDSPFVAVLLRVKDEGENQRLIFTTNLGDEVAAGPDHQLRICKDPETGEVVPYIDVRNGLEARVARSVFYDLVALGERRQIDGSEMFGLMSGGLFFPFGKAHEIFG